MTQVLFDGRPVRTGTGSGRAKQQLANGRNYGMPFCKA